MVIDNDVRYRVLQSRDARFDGKFFAAVVTTGVYCRPICSVKTPLRKNVRFFPCAATAEAAGFRPCKRCRPEAAPGTPAWNGTESSVSRGIRLINAGFLEGRSIDDLAATLSITARQLRRLFVRHVGVPPKTLDVKRRTHFASALLSQTSLSVTAVAYESGFASVRQFNDTFRRSFGVAPSDVRRASAAPGQRRARDPETQLRLSYRPPFDWSGLMRFFAARAIEGIEVVTETEYRRSFSLGAGETAAGGLVSITNDAARNAIVVRIGAPPARLLTIAAKVRAMFDLSADPAMIVEHLRADPRIRPLVTLVPGLRIPAFWDSFETAVRAVVGQQISVEAAVRLLGEITRRCGAPIARPADGRIVRLFPTPAQLAAAKLDDLGMPAVRKRTLKHLAGAWLDADAPVGGYPPADGLPEWIRQIPGIGPWTAQYVALRGFGEPDAFPASDVALRAAVGRLLGREGHATPAEVLELSRKWRPWRGYAAQLLWQSSGSLTRRKAS